MVDPGHSPCSKGKMEMKDEYRGYIIDLIEKEYISNGKEIEKLFHKKFPGANVTDDEILSVKKEYCFKRLGTRNFAPKRLRAYQIFERGGSVEDAVREVSIFPVSAENFMREWKAKHIMARLNDIKKSKKPVIHAFPGGAVFGTWTNKESIWKE